jgi:putative pyoverdin transport system ATP-binding/permease protein
MHIIRLLQIESPGRLKGTLYVTCLAGLANAVLLGLINLAAADAARGNSIDAALFLMYGLAFAIFTLANRASLRQANAFVQGRIGELRLRLTDKIRRAELRTLERMGRGQLYAVVAQETNHLSQNFPLLVSAAQGLFLLTFCLLYIATLSVVSFFVVTAVTVAGLLAFHRRRAALNVRMLTVHAQEGAMLESLTHVTEGFPAIRLNANRNDALFARFTQIVDQLEALVVGIGGKWVVLLLFNNAFLYVMLGIVVFLLPMFFQGYTDVIYKIAAAALFCVWPVGAITSAAPLYSRANIGLGHVFRMEDMLDAQSLPVRAAAESVPSRFSGFREIEFKDLGFAYKDSAGNDSFTTGPMNLQLRRGELLFLLGGNGSGKSTVLKLMCGLYPASTGQIQVDGVRIEVESLQAYRELFSCIFPDFHLFDRLHGLDHVDSAQVTALIARMGLSDKVTYTDNRFSTLELSTGQRKRLAMVVSLLEDREIFFFDEWAADQDAQFREAFYAEMLPALKRRGKTVVVVTHDDRFWHVADRIVTLDLGRIVSQDAPATEA